MNILRSRIDNKTVERFLKILNEKDSPKSITTTPTEIRKVHEKILQKCSEIIPGMKGYCAENSQKTVMRQQTSEWLYQNGYISTILKPFFYNVSIITNVLSHPNSENPTTDTINALVYALKDIILWFEEICRTDKIVAQLRTTCLHTLCKASIKNGSYFPPQSKLVGIASVFDNETKRINTSTGTAWTVFPLDLIKLTNR